MRFRIRTAVVAIVLVAACHSAASAEFLILSHTAKIRGNNETVEFTLTFNQAPDFFTTDGFGVQENAFIGYFSSNTNTRVTPENANTLMRGDQIAANGGLIPFVTGPITPTPGLLRGLVPFSVNGSVVTFVASFDDLGMSAPLGRFMFESYENGVLTGRSGAALPEPSSMVLAALGSLSLMGLVWKRGRRKSC